MKPEEIRTLIAGYVNGEVPDYQMSAWTMAVCMNGMTAEETTALTLAMEASGDVIDLSDIPGVTVDKHSTGGVADTTTLVLAPLIAAVGVPIAKMSGRGLGHTGGTIDKLESIPGLKTSLRPEEFVQQVKDIGLAVTGQTGNLAPADKKLYALRDVTDTVRSIPLIASSIMSKKLASGAQAIVLDVKVGDGAFMKTAAEGQELARTMVNIGQLSGRPVTAVLTRMEEPLGRAIGNALEVREAILTLRGQGSASLRELCVVLGAEMMLLAHRAATVEQARQALEEALDSGAALAKFKEFVAAQHGDARIVDDLSLLPKAPVVKYIHSTSDGVVEKIAAEQLGLVAMHLGAGRAHKDDTIDASVGIVLHRRVGQSVVRGEMLAEIHARTEADAKAAERDLAQLIAVKSRTAESPRTAVTGHPRPGEGKGSLSLSGQVIDIIRSEAGQSEPNSKERIGWSISGTKHRLDAVPGGVAEKGDSGIQPSALLRQAEQARAAAYAPYSQFAVGAALQLSDGQIITGANIENAAYGSTMCAERTAIFQAVMKGLSGPSQASLHAVALAVVADSAGPVSPCGACRQVLAEFCPPDMPVHLGDMHGRHMKTTLSELLPHSFQAKQMRE